MNLSKLASFSLPCLLVYKMEIVLKLSLEWLTPVIPNTWKAEIGGLWIKANPSKKVS
jgi:hypothetical protein